MIVVPLVVASIVRGFAANNNPQALKKLALIALIFIIFTTVMAAIIGIGLGQLIQPGSHLQLAVLTNSAEFGALPVSTAAFPSARSTTGEMLSLLPKTR